MTKICCVCGKQECSYKCPVCRESYCSVDCCKEHKRNDCQPVNQLQENKDAERTTSNTKYDFPTEDTVPVSKLVELQHSEEIRNCLKNPHVRNIMRAILTDKNPTEAIATAMTEPIFVEVANACLKIIEPQVTDESR